MSLLACLDNSPYADSICIQVAWAAKRLGTKVDLLHVQRPKTPILPGMDYGGTLGLDPQITLMESMVRIEEERSKLDHKKGQLLLTHGEKKLQNAGLTTIQSHHRHGDFVDTILEMEASTDIIFIGKRGEEAKPDSVFLGSNLERVARAVHKPLFVVSRHVRSISRFMIAYDGKDSSKKAVSFVANSPLLKGLDCHLVTVQADKDFSSLQEVEAELRAAGFSVYSHVHPDGAVDTVIADVVDQYKIDLLLTGAYSHSRLRSFFLGSTTASLIKRCPISLVLFR